MTEVTTAGLIITFSLIVLKSIEEAQKLAQSLHSKASVHINMWGKYWVMRFSTHEALKLARKSGEQRRPLKEPAQKKNL